GLARRWDAGGRGCGGCAVGGRRRLRQPGGAEEKKKNPADETGGQRSHKSETRISAIADFAREGKRKKKALPLSPCGPQDGEPGHEPAQRKRGQAGPVRAKFRWAVYRAVRSARGTAAEATAAATTKTTTAAKAAAAAARTP